MSSEEEEISNSEEENSNSEEENSNSEEENSNSEEENNEKEKPIETNNLNKIMEISNNLSNMNLNLGFKFKGFNNKIKHDINTNEMKKTIEVQTDEINYNTFNETINLKDINRNKLKTMNQTLKEIDIPKPPVSLYKINNLTKNSDFESKVIKKTCFNEEVKIEDIEEEIKEKKSISPFKTNNKNKVNTNSIKNSNITRSNIEELYKRKPRKVYDENELN